MSFDYSYLKSVGLEQNGNKGCVDRALDNVSRANNKPEISSEIRKAQSLMEPPKGCPKVTLSSNESGLYDESAIKMWSAQNNFKSVVISNPSKTMIASSYEDISKGIDVVISSGTSENMNHAINVVGAFKETITYSNSSTSYVKLIYLSNGQLQTAKASSFVGGDTNIFWIFK